MYWPLMMMMLAAPPDTAPSQPREAEQENRRRQEVAQFALQQARRLEVAAGQMSAKLHPEPLLRWSNPSAGSVYGEVFVWSDAGRPVVAASIYRWYHPFTDSTLEAVSLSARPVMARDGEDLLWESPAAGVAFRNLEDVPSPAALPAARLRQMRTLARRFTAELQDERGGETVPRLLRLLDQPVYRYASDKSGVIDGALFAFVEATDPEAWLLIEAAQHDDASGWQYAVARMNSDALAIRLAGVEVASWPKLIEPWRHRRGGYTLQTIRTAARQEQPAARPTIP